MILHKNAGLTWHNPRAIVKRWKACGTPRAVARDGAVLAARIYKWLRRLKAQGDFGSMTIPRCERNPWRDDELAELD